MSEDPVTLKTALEQGCRRLEGAGVESPRLDAELLLAHALGRSRTFLFAHLPDPLPDAAASEFEALLKRREAREPLPYLLETWEWLGMPFRVTPAVLIPRPETETLVEEAARRLSPAARILDVGAGTGCIAAGMARLVPESRVTTLELSPAAAAVARENLERLGLSGRVSVREGGFPWALVPGEVFEALVSNPPYIPSAEVEALAPELRDHEPRLALDGGPDGLEVLRALVERGPDVLVPGGLLALEVAQGQAQQVAGLLRDQGSWEAVEVLRDLAGTERVVLARRR